MHYAIKESTTDKTRCIAPAEQILISVVMAESQIKGATKQLECFIVGPMIFPTESHYATPLEVLPEQYTRKPINLSIFPKLN